MMSKNLLLENCAISLLRYSLCVQRAIYDVLSRSYNSGKFSCIGNMTKQVTDISGNLSEIRSHQVEILMGITMPSSFSDPLSRLFFCCCSCCSFENWICRFSCCRHSLMCVVFTFYLTSFNFPEGLELALLLPSCLLLVTRVLAGN